MTNGVGARCAEPERISRTAARPRPDTCPSQVPEQGRCVSAWVTSSKTTNPRPPLEAKAFWTPRPPSGRMTTSQQFDKLHRYCIGARRSLHLEVVGARFSAAYMRWSQVHFLVISGRSLGRLAARANCGAQRSEEVVVPSLFLPPCGAATTSVAHVPPRADVTAIDAQLHARLLPSYECSGKRVALTPICGLRMPVSAPV